jgi:predicted Zn-dependent protease
MKYSVLFFLVFFITGCASTTLKNQSGVDRKQLLLMPQSMVEGMAKDSYRTRLQEASKKNKLNIDSFQVSRVKRISNRLIANATYFKPEANQWPWEVNVEDSDEVNAYCMPGGKIMVYSGLIRKLNATDDELAAVIGHEISHALREHGRERMSTAAIQQLGLIGFAAYISNTSSRNRANATMQAASLGTTLFFALPNSRTQEREADAIGLELAARSGFNPFAAVTLWEKMKRQDTKKPPEFLSTHPSDDNRIRELTDLAYKLKPLYESSRSR